MAATKLEMLKVFIVIGKDRQFTLSKTKLASLLLSAILY